MFVTTSGALHLLLAAQAVSASVTGTVRDARTDEPVAGAVVLFSDLERSAVTDAAGRYLFTGVPAGPQHVLVRRIGYTPRTLHALVPSRGAVEIHIGLRAQAITLVATEARAPVPVRGLEGGDSTAFPNRALSMSAVRHHPLIAEPDAFLALGGGEVVLRPEAPGAVHVRGGAGDQVGYFLDGIPVFSPYHVAGSFSAWNPDALSGLELTAPSAAPSFPDVLSGVISAMTRAPGPELQTQGTLSTTQARFTVAGPLGRSRTGAGFLVSARSGFPGFPAPKREASYLSGENGDWLAKLESPLLGGRVRVLGYASDNEIGTSVAAASEAAPDTAHNEFAWYSRSFGGDWTGRLGPVGTTVRAWRAESEAGALWRGDSALEHLRARRRDDGLLVTVQIPGTRSTTALGFRTERSSTGYQLLPLAGSGRSLVRSASTPVSAAFVRHARVIVPRTELALALSGAVVGGTVHWSPQAELRWRPAGALAVSGAYARRHQFSQSWRNAESVVGMIFPVDLYVGVGGAGVPVARSDEGIVAAVYRAAGLRLGAQAYARTFEGLVLVAPRTGGPFATSGFAVGGGSARGLAVEAGVNGSRYGIVAGYGLQHVRLDYSDSSYTPDHGATHTIDGGVVAFPSPTVAVRLSASGVFGRRATALGDPLEWEACNLLDRGCEFAGSPRHRTDALGATSLPAYVRLDIGIRKHWHVRVAGRDGVVALFGTLTNVLGRSNVLTIAPDPTTGRPVGIEMRPRAPLVVGLDWRY